MGTSVTEIAEILSIIAIGGAFGGLLAELTRRGETQLGEVLTFDRRMAGRSLVGMGAAFVGFAVLSVLPTHGTVGQMDPFDYVKIFGVSITCGFLGSRLLKTGADKMFRELKHEVDSKLAHERALTNALENKVDSGLAVERALTSAQQYYSNGRYALAVQLATDALKIDPNKLEAKWVLGLAYSRMDENSGESAMKAAGYQKAIQLFDEILQSDPHFVLTRYDRACVLAVAGGDKRRVLEDLSEVVAEKPEYRRIALDDPDFESLRADPDFARIVGSK